MKLFYIWNCLQNNLGEEDTEGIDEIRFTIDQQLLNLSDEYMEFIIGSCLLLHIYLTFHAKMFWNRITFNESNWKDNKESAMC